MGAGDWVPTAVCTILSLDHQVATAPMPPCIISEGGRQAPHTVGSRMDNLGEGPWQVPSSCKTLLSGCRSSMFGGLGGSCPKSQWTVGSQGFTGHMTGRKTIQQRGGHDRDGTILDSGWMETVSEKWLPHGWR